MRALRLTEIRQPLELRDLPRPEPGPNEVLVRVEAAGICHSDAHYRSGTSLAGPLPIVLGHEVAGVVEVLGAEVPDLRVGERVCLHYQLSCGRCSYCRSGNEQFCPQGRMLGKHRDGGYAEYVAVPAANAVPLPVDIPFEQGAIMMCSSATSLHALRKARLRPGETVAVFGAGGLGLSAVQLARAFGAPQTYAVDINSRRLELAAGYGAVPVDASGAEPAGEIRRLTAGRGVDVALELIGLPETIRAAVRSLAPFGRAALVGIANRTAEIDTYGELIGREAEMIGVSDHLLSELPYLLELARRGKLDLAPVVTGTVPLEAAAVNRALDALEGFGDGVRTVIKPFAR
jgi:2-desacetyl-2-hydroxyethyl bacteriochlorophyllide A dehydrogenase